MTTVSELYKKHGYLCRRWSVYLDDECLDITIAGYCYNSRDKIDPVALKIFEVASEAFLTYTKEIKTVLGTAMDRGSFIEWYDKIVVFPTMYIYENEVHDMPPDTSMLDMMDKLIQRYRAQHFFTKK